MDVKYTSAYLPDGAEHHILDLATVSTAREFCQFMEMVHPDAVYIPTAPEDNTIVFENGGGQPFEPFP